MLRHLLAAAVVAAAAGPAASQAPRKPNVIVFLSDDVGYAEYGFQGARDIPTPHIDSIAKNGVRFTSGYVSGPYCSPTRAGLLTGRYQTRFGHEFNEGGAAGGNRGFGLPVEQRTVADRLRALGYATCAVGKWHLGGGPTFIATARGFDEFYGTVANTPFFNPPNFIDTRVSPNVTPVRDDAFYTTDAYAARAVDWIGRQAADRPYFLYLPFNAQHAPLQAPPRYLARFPSIADEKRKTFAAMMGAMDDAVGAVLAKVRERGEEENTLIFFLCDNGGPTVQTTSRNTPLRGFKATTLEGGIRVPFCAQWKGRIPAGQTFDHPIIQLDILPTAVAAAGGTPAADWRPDGVNLLPFLSGERREPGPPHAALFWRFGQQWAVRKGDFKLVASTPDGVAVPRLFNLRDDIGEATDLAARMPEKVRELSDEWDRWNAGNIAPLWVPAKKKKKAADDEDDE